MKYNYKVGDKVVIVEDANCSEGKVTLHGYYSAINKIGTILKIEHGGAHIGNLPSTCGTDIQSPCGIEKCNWFYKFNQFKPYVEGQKPEPKFKVNDVIESTNGLVICKINRLTDFGTRAECTVIHANLKGQSLKADDITFIDFSVFKYKLYEYGMGDEIKLFNDSISIYEVIRIDGNYIVTNKKLEIEFQGYSAYIMHNDTYAMFKRDQITLIKSARWTRENESKLDDMVDAYAFSISTLAKSNKQNRYNEILKVLNDCPISFAMPKLDLTIKALNKDGTKGIDTSKINEPQNSTDRIQLNFPKITDPVHLMTMPDNNIKWKSKDLLFYGLIYDEEIYSISLSVNLKKYQLYFVLRYFINDSWDVLKTCKSLKKAKKYALKHYMENSNE